MEIDFTWKESPGSESAQGLAHAEIEELIIKGFINIQAIGAKDLLPSDKDSADPYVKFVFPDDKDSETKHINKSLNPVWNQLI